MIKIIDATLREGNQAPGVNLDPTQTALVANLLLDVGVDMIECGHPAASRRESERTRYVKSLQLPVPLLAHARANTKDIDAVADTGAEYVGIFLGVNTLSRKARVPGRDAASIREMATGSILHARARGLKVRFSIEDASRTPQELLVEIGKLASRAGAERICYADTVGVAEPTEVFESVSLLKCEVQGVELEVHLHNDRGLAIANSLAALDAGADWISTSVNGLGERCGITDLNTLLANLYARGERDITNPEGLQRLSRTIAGYSRRPVPFSAPVVGRDAFVHTSRLHCLASERDQSAYYWLPPKTLGWDNEQGCHALPSTVKDLVLEPKVISARELKYHRNGPGERYVMIDERFLEDCRQYCIVRTIPSIDQHGPGHVDGHTHHVDSLFLFLGNEENLKGLRCEVVLGPVNTNFVKIIG
ncbi:MAG: LeuA family protein [Candidatus Thiodiazotropha taylori]|nr:LeuA family protein [Candidatus Thiodiazotropha taylori]MCG8096927.1 LeuA family protein [Candidatus Thiodiazotropha endolucinida]MCG8109104.1 LeuA family protein [Candidatus Thiodiazotropha taylori]MCG8113373.1 LeuA family protein [Candidatus Thiodiazotropha taylori]MCW4281440.1 LeuA family protein [Candidatus Thiodiazotropha taylori]